MKAVLVSPKPTGGAMVEVFGMVVSVILAIILAAFEAIFAGVVVVPSSPPETRADLPATCPPTI